MRSRALFFGKYGISASYVVVFLNHEKEGGKRRRHAHRQSGKGYWLDFKGPLGHRARRRNIGITPTAGYLYNACLLGTSLQSTNHTQYNVAYFQCRLQYRCVFGMHLDGPCFGGECN